MVLLKAIVLKLIEEDNNIAVIDSDIADKLYFKCYKALNAIREVIRNDELTDFRMPGFGWGEQARFLDVSKFMCFLPEKF